MFKLRGKQCAISCPENGCVAVYSTVPLFHKMAKRERARFKTILTDITFSDSSPLRQFHSALLDLMTVKCPSCKNPVDPFPDACSAIMCLNCGHHYCNYCFKAFASGVTERDRSAAHEHAATHNSNDRPETRDAFLPSHLIVQGQRIYLKSLLTQSLIAALSLAEGGINRQEVALALVMCYDELLDLGIDGIDVWKEVDIVERSRQKTVSDSGSTKTAGGARGFSSSETDDNQTNAASLPPNPSTAPQPKQGGRQIANAILTDNGYAISQILHTIRDASLDVDYIDTRHGHPLATLAILAGQPHVAVQLIKRGADPYVCNTGGRDVLYIATEAGLVNVVQAIIDKHPGINFNRASTTETQRYFPLHVAARYNHGHLINLLVTHGAELNPEEGEHGYAPITLAMVLGHEWACAELIKLGCRLDLRALNGRTPMFVAAEKGLSEMIRLVFEKTDFDIDAAVVRPSGLRLLHVAAFHQKVYTVTQLIGLGASIDMLDDEGGYTALSMAIIGNCPAAALELINAGADVNIASITGRKPMCVIIFYFYFCFVLI